MSLILYHTDGCHLCEQAAAIVLPLAQSLSITVTHVDICELPALAEQYGTTIPVIRRADGQELNWPFAAHDVQVFLGVSS